MAVLKVACPKCGQKVSGDESFFGSTVECPVCTSKIPFPDPPEDPATESSVQERLRDSETEKLQSRGPTGGAVDPAPTSSSTSDPDPPPQKETSSIPLPSPNTAPSGDGSEVPSPVLGVVAMVLGLVSVMLFCIPGIIFGPAAIISGHLARSRAKHSPVQPAPGSVAALTGLILGYLSLAGFILALVILPGLIEAIRESKPPASE